MATRRNKKAIPGTDCRPEPHVEQVNPWLSLAQGVVYQAIMDWRRLDEGMQVPLTTYDGLRAFFSSSWCEQLLLFTSIHPSRILAKLEKHTEEVSR